MEQQNIQERTVYFDYLRVFATFAIIVLHIAAKNWYTTDVNGFQWQTFNFFDCSVKWGVPVFVMISGALFLKRDVSLKKMYSKYILRMMIAFAVWATIYALFDKGTIKQKISVAVQGHYHMWFILMIIGIYMCLPFIKVITQNVNRTKYFLFLSFLFAFFIPEIVIIANLFGNEIIKAGVNAINNNLSNMHIHMVLGFVGYFVAGYYVDSISLSKKQRLLIYVFGFFGFSFTIGMESMVAVMTQQPNGSFCTNMSINVLFEALTVFTWFKYRKLDNDRINRFIQRLSKYSFGAYLVHALVLEQMDLHLGINSLSFNPILSVLGIGSFVFIVSFGLSAVLNKIPVVKEYMV